MMKMPTLSIVILLTAVSASAGEPITMRAEKRADVLKSHVAKFQMDLIYSGPQDRPFQQLSLTVQPVEKDGMTPFHRRVQISEEQAITIIDHLASEGFLDHANDDMPKFGDGSLYLLRVQAGDNIFAEDLGWGLKMLHRLDGLQKVLDGDAATAMAGLTGRLGGYRRQWEAGK